MSGPAQAFRAVQERTAAANNRWYDRRMYEDWAQDLYQGSDFHNYGYWTAETHDMKRASENLMEVLLAFIPDKTGSILDVACGKGATTRHLLRYYTSHEVTGINISEKQLRDCRRNAPGCSFHHMNATDLSFPDGRFDNVICVEAAFHFASRKKFLEEACRVIKPGGRLVLSDILRDARRGPAGPLAPDRQVLDPSEYRDLFFKAGFEQLEVVDATYECNAGLRRHRLRMLRNKLKHQEIDLAAFRRRQRKIIEEELAFDYYLLVCAQKGDG